MLCHDPLGVLGPRLVQPPYLIEPTQARWPHQLCFMDQDRPVSESQLVVANPSVLGVPGHL